MRSTGASGETPSASARVGWLLLTAVAAILLALAYSPRAPWRAVAAAIALPLAPDWLLLARRTAAEAITEIGRVTLAAPAPRFALEILAVLTGLAVYVFSPLGGVLLVAWMGLGGMVVALLRGAAAFQSAVMGSALSGTVLALSLALAEGLFRLPALARRLGPPSERAAWFSRRYDRLWEQNVFGFRSRHESVSRKSGVFRVLALGDSFTWGDAVAQSDSLWPALLEAEVQNQLPGRDVEVINMGQRGSTTANEAELLRRVGWQFQPDLVLIQWFLNDALPSGPNFQHRRGAWLVPSYPLLASPLRTGAIRQSALFFLLQQQYDRLRAPARPYSRLYREGAIGWEETKAAWAEIADSARARGVPVVVIIFPSFTTGSWSPETHPYGPIHRLVSHAVQAAHLEVFDLTPVFAAEGGNWRRWWATPYDSHPSIAAHRLAAHALTSLVIRGALASRPDSLSHPTGGTHARP